MSERSLIVNQVLAVLAAVLGYFLGAFSFARIVTRMVAK
jgi:glycerol-3-phosphate acyltransferase PlsY